MKKRISVALLPGHLSKDKDWSNVCSVVIDVLRATTVMTAAGDAGCRSLQTCAEIQQARDLSQSMSPSPLLCGERHCKQIDGFDFGNSPSEYSSAKVGGKDLVLTTTNGTHAIQATERSRRMIAASFWNLSVIVDQVQEESDLQLVCAGTNRQISCEDILLAGAIVDGICQRESNREFDDSARIARAAWNQYERSGQCLEDALAESLGGRNLIQVGYQSDLQLCAKRDIVKGFMQRKQGTSASFQYVR